MHVSVRVSEKSQRLLIEGRVSRIESSSFEVRGDTGTYQVSVLDASEVVGFCRCESNRLCSHLLAACAYAIANPVEVPAFQGDPFAGLS